MTIAKPCFLLAQFALAALAVGGSSLKPWNTLSMQVPKGVQRAAPLGEKLSTDMLHLAVAISCRDAAGLQAFVDSVSDPKSPNYLHFIGPEEVGNRFGIDAANLKKVSDYLTSQGLSIKLIAKNRLSILADATVAQAESAFHTKIHEYIAADAPMGTDASRYSFTVPPSVPESISPYVTYVEGLDDFNRPKPAFTLTPDELRTLYRVAASYTSGFQGQGRCVGISSFDQYGLQNIPLQYAQFNLPIPPEGVGTNITVRSIDGSNGNVTSGAPGEADADMQCVLAMAPLCNLIIYDDSNRGGAGYLACLTQEAEDNDADIITESYGRSGATTAFWASIHTLHLSMSAQGITYMCASGDSGTSWIADFPYPDVDPEVLTVGGTTVAIDSNGNRTSEVVWDNTTKGTAGGGGWADTGDAFNILPPYQKGNGVPTNIPYRLVPDISLDSDSRCGYQIFRNGIFLPSQGIGTGGTSCASPTFAGMLADCEQQIIAGGSLPANSLGYRRFGRIQDLLYSFNGDPTVFYDVVSGTNGTLPNGAVSVATPGWDTASGWGAVICAGFIDRVLNIPELTAVTVAPQSVTGGASATGTVTLSAVAPAGGIVVNLSSSNAAATVPTTVTVSAGSKVGTFTISTSVVPTSTSVTITATLGGGTFSAPLMVTTGSLTGISVDPSSALGGSICSGQVTLNGGAGPNGTVVILSSSSSSVTVPATVTVPAGAVLVAFEITTSAVNSNTPVTITAAAAGITHTAILTVDAAALTNLVLPGSVIGGSPATGSVLLNGPAGPGGAVVSLTGGKGVTLPALVTVPAGTNTVSFSVQTSPVASSTAVTITATLGSGVQSTTLTILPPTETAVTLSPSTVTGGASATGTVTLSGPAPAAGVVVNLSCGAFGVTVPATVTAPAGASSATFTVTTSAVTTTVSATISASQGSVSKTASLTIIPLALMSFSFNPTAVTGGGSSTGTVVLNGPAIANGGTVYLSVPAKSPVTIPASVVVPAGQTSATFTANTTSVTSMAVVSVSASYGSSTASQTATLTVNPATLLSVSVDPSTLSGGATSSGTVTLTGAASAGGFAIKLSSNSASATVPASVSIPAGKTSVIFSVKTVPVKSVTTAAITATLGGVSQAATLTIQPPSLESVTLKPATVIGLTASVGTITLSGPAATGGMVVALTSSSTAAVVPVSVTIAAGKSSATFTVKTTSVAAQTVATISAALNGDQVSSELTISPPAVTALVLSPASVVGGKTSTGTVTLGTAAPVGGISVKLGSGSVSASVPANVVVPAGKTSAKFTITTSVVTGKTVAAITATLGASSKSANLTITK